VKRRPPAVVDDPDDAEAAEAAAVRILAGAAQSADSLQRKLRQRGFSMNAIRTAVGRCRELGYVDDGALAASVVKRHVRAGHGTTRVIADLRRRGISNDAATTALQELDESEEQRAANEFAQKLYDRRNAGEEVERSRRRIGAALQRRGFGTPVILRALSAVDTAIPHDDGGG